MISYILTRHTKGKSCIAELKSQYPSIKEITPDILECSVKADLTKLALGSSFIQQILPDIQRIEVPSISKGVEAVANLLLDSQANFEKPWHLHVFDKKTMATGKNSNRSVLFTNELIKFLKRKQKSYLKSLHSNQVIKNENFGTLVQIFFTSPAETVVSISSPDYGLNPYPAGYANIEEDLKAPSRAYKKLLEALSSAYLEIKPKDNCVDLGASPGGWSYVAIKNKARVVAIDRSPLADSLKNNPLLVQKQTDAFKFSPDSKVDWLLCDVIAEPGKNFDLIKRWVKDELCKKFVVTLKFKGDPDLKLLAQAREFFGEHLDRWYIRQLTNNKNEVTCFGII